MFLIGDYIGSNCNYNARLGIIQIFYCYDQCESLVTKFLANCTKNYKTSVRGDVKCRRAFLVWKSRRLELNVTASCTNQQRRNRFLQETSMQRQNSLLFAFFTFGFMLMFYIVLCMEWNNSSLIYKQGKKISVCLRIESSITRILTVFIFNSLLLKILRG